MRLPRFVAICLALLLAAGPLPAQVGQDSVEPGETAPPPAAGDALSIARAAAARGDSPEALSQYLRVLATQPNNVEALSGAGRAALAVGDINAATAFFGRADSIAPNDGAVKAGLASATVQTGNARAALRYFRQAQSLGIAPATIAADRGLAYDLDGQTRRAQAEYQLALRGDPRNSAVLERLALSQSIGGDLPAALATLDPLLRRQEIPAWRTRAFAKALGGDATGAEADVAFVLPPNQVAAIRPYLARLAALKPGEKAAAVFLGRFPPPGEATSGRAAPASPPLPRAPTTIAAAGIAPPQRTAMAQATTQPTPRIIPPAPPRLVAEPSIGAATAVAAAPALVEAVADDPAAHRRAAAADRAATLAAGRKKAALAQAAEEARARKANPARHWVQVAGGANRRDLPRAWDQLKDKWPKQLAGRSPWTTHYRFTNRLLIGPFPNAGAAQDWVSDRKREGFAAFRVETGAGDPVERL